MRISIRRLFVVALGATMLASLSGGVDAAPEGRAITEVEVRKDGDTTEIVLRGARDPIYTAFMGEAPPRLVIELPGVTVEGVETPFEVDDAIVRHVLFGEFGQGAGKDKLARVTVELAAEAEYEILPGGDELVVQLRPAPMASMAPAEQDETAPEVAEPTEPMEPMEAMEATEVPAAAAELSRIVRVSVDGDVVEVDADGPIDNADSFVLESPSRLVVDFWGASASAWKPVMGPASGAVEQVRIGSHADKVRVVVDLRAPLLSHSLEPTSHGMKLVLSPETAAAAIDEAMAEATPEPTFEREPFKPMLPGDVSGAEEMPEMPAAPDMAASDMAASGTGMGDLLVVDPAELSEPMQPAEPAGPVTVESVSFESLPSIDRVVLAHDGVAVPTRYDPDAVTLILDLEDAKMVAGAERRMDTREFHGAVDLISLFRTPDVPGDNVRLVVKHRAGATPTVRTEHGQLFVEFERTEDMAAEPAEADPAPAAPRDYPQPLAPEASKAPASIDPTAGSVDDPFFDGPAQPAAIDILEEGGLEEDKQYAGRRISLDFKDADIGNILRLIAEVSDLNIIAGEEVDGDVTIRLIDVPWDQALDVILLTKGLGFARVGNVLRIAPIDILKQEEEARLAQRRAREKLEDLVVKLQPVNYANVDEVQNLVTRLLSPRGTVNVDSRTSTLIIKDIPSVIHEATALIKAIDTQTPQVLIEAKIVEATLNFSRSLGARWGVGYRPVGATGGAWTGGSPDFRLADGGNTNLLGVGNQASNFIVSNPISAAAGTLTLGLLGINDHLQLDLELQAAEANDKGKVISSPRVVTLDNREATIQQGVAIAFESSDGDSVSTSFIDAVLELAVKPHITADRSIVMEIKVSRNAPQLSSVSGDVVGIAKNETSTEALVMDGQTMVLGGIYIVDKGKNANKVPFLADIPVIGTAFRSLVINDVREELLIFVTPRIVESIVPAS